MGLRHMAGRCGLSAFLRPRCCRLALAGSAIALAAAEPGCTSGGTGPQAPCPPGQTCQVRLTLLHTSDIHSRIFPYDLQILQVDSELGLGTLDEVKNVGGVARVSYVVNRERARADRVCTSTRATSSRARPSSTTSRASRRRAPPQHDGHRRDGHREPRVRRWRDQRRPPDDEVGRLPAPRGQLRVPVARAPPSTRASTRSSSPSRSSTSRG